MTGKQLVRALTIDAVLVALIVWCAYIWASWVDPAHRAYDRARGFMALTRVTWRASYALARLSIYSETEARKAVAP
jgi:hypothetical protein